MDAKLKEKLEAYYAKLHPPRPSTPGQRKALMDFYASVSNRKLVEGEVVQRTVTIPSRADRVSLPIRTPCKFEGSVATWCRACAEGYKVRHCECPEADWDFCARQATPREHGQNCQTCPNYVTPDI